MKDFDFISRKIAIIAYMSIINFVVTTLLAQFVSKFVLPKYDATHGYFINWVKIVTAVSIIATLAYLCRQVSEVMPLPPLGTDVFDPQKVKEIKSSVLTAFTFFMWLGKDVKNYDPVLRFF